MQSAMCMSLKCELNNFRVASCCSGNLRVVSYNSTSLWIELIIRLWVGSCISLRYIKSAVSVYIISSLHVKQSKRNKVIWFILIMVYTWEQPRIYCDLNGNELEKSAGIYANKDQLQKQLITGNGIWKIRRKATAMESNFSTVTALTFLLKQDLTTSVFMKTLQNFRTDLLYNISR